MQASKNILVEAQEDRLVRCLDHGEICQISYYNPLFPRKVYCKKCAKRNGVLLTRHQWRIYLALERLRHESPRRYIKQTAKTLDLSIYQVQRCIKVLNKKGLDIRHDPSYKYEIKNSLGETVKLTQKQYQVLQVINSDRLLRQGDFIDQASTQLNISKTALNNYILSLKKLGFQIPSRQERQANCREYIRQFAANSNQPRATIVARLSKETGYSVESIRRMLVPLEKSGIKLKRGVLWELIIEFLQQRKQASLKEIEEAISNYNHYTFHDAIRKLREQGKVSTWLDKRKLVVKLNA